MEGAKQPGIQGVCYMVSEFISVMTSWKALNDILKASLDLHTFNQVTAALSKVNADLITAQGAALKAQDEQARLAEKVRELESQLAAIARWESMSQNYNLRALVPEVYVYEYVASGPGADVPHYACANCFLQRVRSILQLTNSGEDTKWYECLHCKTILHANNPHYQPPTHYAPTPGNPNAWMAR
jgi:hypothetical protein